MSKLIFNDDAIAKTCIVNAPDIKGIVAMEEMAECQKEISKWLRGEGDTEHLTEEIADVFFILAQVAHICEIPMLDIQEQIGIKMERQENRDEDYQKKLLYDKDWRVLSIKLKLAEAGL